MFKVGNKDTTNIYMISTKRYLFVVYDVFDKASVSNTNSRTRYSLASPLVPLLLTLNIFHTFCSVSIVEFEQVKYILGFQ